MLIEGSSTIKTPKKTEDSPDKMQVDKSDNLGKLKYPYADVCYQQDLRSIIISNVFIVTDKHSGIEKQMDSIKINETDEERPGKRMKIKETNENDVAGK